MEARMIVAVEEAFVLLHQSTNWLLVRIKADASEKFQQLFIHKKNPTFLLVAVKGKLRASVK